MRHHRQPEISREQKERAKKYAGEECLFDSRPTLIDKVRACKNRRRNQNSRDRRASSAAEDFSTTFEQVSANNGFFAESGADREGEKHSGESGVVADEKMVSLIDRRRAQRRHHYGFHHDFENNAEQSAAQ